MFFLYSVLLTVGFFVLVPRFLFDAVFNGKYAAGFTQRLGFLPKFDSRDKNVVWLHCVSVGEVNAARPLAIKIQQEFPDLSLVISTTTLTGQKLAQTVFTSLADLVFYFPFEWKFTVRRALRQINPSVVLLMETELWFNFIRESHKSGSRVVIINGRLSEKSVNRYRYIKKFMRRVLGYVDLALMQGNADAARLMSLGIRTSKVRVTGNLKFDHDLDENEAALTDELRERFGIELKVPLIIGASTHSPEERWILDAFQEVLGMSPEKVARIMIAPRHPERFDEVAEVIKKSGLSLVRRSDAVSADDRSAVVILLDSIGELRAAYPLAEIVFVGGSLIPHGGQSIFEPAAVGKAVVTGPHTQNFSAAIKEFLDKDAIIQLPSVTERDAVPKLAATFNELLSDADKRNSLGTHALSVMNSSRGAVSRTLEYLSPFFGGSD